MYFSVSKGQLTSYINFGIVLTNLTTELVIQSTQLNRGFQGILNQLTGEIY